MFGTIRCNHSSILSISSSHRHLKDLGLRASAPHPPLASRFFVRMQRPGLQGQGGGQVTPSFMLPPKKDRLVKEYFYPDNMPSAEKLELEPEGVAVEFKMSESDCGSSRVQVAQLTAKIKHLSSVLHKKDKHSRRGLQAMVQRRKKLLKYLRRTDWESYCFVISKLGLKDNPDYKK
ncbi:hypothetical protein AAC387_Pa06g3275 [Persea americana]